MVRVANAAAGALIIAALSTFRDFAGTLWITDHRAVFGLLHGTCSASALASTLARFEGAPSTAPSLASPAA